MCVFVRVCAYECRHHRGQKASFGSLELQLQVVVSQPPELGARNPT